MQHVVRLSAVGRGVRRERASVAEWLQAGLLAANLAWTTLRLGGYRAETMLVTLALTGALLALHFATCAMEKRSLRETDFSGWCIIPFLAYAVGNVLFVTPVRWLGWLDWMAWTNAFAVFWVVRNGVRSRNPRRLLFLTLVALGIVAVVLGSYQRFVQPDWLMLGRQQVEQFVGRASGPFGIPNSLAAFLILLLPATGALALRPHASSTERVWWSWVAVVFGFGLLLTVSRGGWLAVGLALIAWPLCAARWKWPQRFAAACAILTVLVSAGAIVYQSSPAARERIDGLVLQGGELSRPVLWRAAWEIFRQHPIAGGGAGSYNARFEAFRPALFRDEPQWAHNEYLNTLSEYGVVGFALLSGAVIIIMMHRRRFRSASSDSADWLDADLTRQGLAIGAVAFALQMVVDFHLKIPALAMTFAVAIALALGNPERPAPCRTPAPSRASRVGWWLAAAVVVSALFPMVRFYRASALRDQARESLDRFVATPATVRSELLDRAEKDLTRATELAPGHAAAWADLAHARALRVVANPTQAGYFGGLAAAAAQRAIALSAIVPEFWMRLGVGLDLQSRRSEARTAFEKAVNLAPRNSHAWYYYAVHLAASTEPREAALRAIATCLSLDPGNAAAEALRVKLNERPGAPFNP